MSEIDISKAVEMLKDGELVVYPTDTLYALGAVVFNKRAVRKVFLVKKRPFEVPLPVAVSSVEDIEKVAFVNDDILRVAKRFLPGSLTLLLNKKDLVSDLVTSGSGKVAVRVPDDELALNLLKVTGPLTVTSANIHGVDPGFFVKDIKSQFRKEDISVYLDVGKLDGAPSTIVDLTGKEAKVLREGVISKSDILDVIQNG